MRASMVSHRLNYFVEASQDQEVAVLIDTLFYFLLIGYFTYWNAANFD